MRAVHFGAGNIGRGFIGLLLSRSGYQICFVDVNDNVVSLLRQRGRYNVSLAIETHDILEVSGVSAVSGHDTEQIISMIEKADLVTTAVGVSLLEQIADVLAQGIAAKGRSAPGPLQVIACENAINASSRLKRHVYERLSEEERMQADQFVYFADTAVDRIVPIQHHADPLEVTVEPFYEWVIDRSGKPPGIAEIKGADYVDHLDRYIERKLFTVNTGHCSAAYFGYLSGYATIHEAMADPLIAAQVRQVLNETGALLVKKYGLSRAEHEHYIEKIMKRFHNPYLSDGIMRVSRSPLRKLSPEDRLVRPALQAFDLGIKPHHLAKAMAAALMFDDQHDAEAIELQKLIQSKGIREAVAQITGIAVGHPVHSLIIRHYEAMTKSV
ncbi:mannitol-1-phosphate 5-dehydrogenase [Paenibacillus thalictri]|uniref:Mannitol-1-phosphate 5-dehydrogenase n=1 Tax=Paenibacillus thalictri TaxID=2527873 RepID=A0A4Q9DXL3_9BACL|nr:mannitol-1-phosphate 5-dehydrogenase [Paenibacillus thalictri]TBL79981.1 mannitol-1-phosphate 5-dehydrogenase [Paenibacillus thalictri]